MTSPAAHTAPAIRYSMRPSLARVVVSRDFQASSAAIRSAGVAWIGCGPAMSMNTVVMAS